MRIQLSKACNSTLYVFGRNAQGLSDFGITQSQQVFVAIFKNLDGERRKIRESVCLNQKAFTLVTGANAARIKALQHMHRLTHRERAFL